MGEARRSDRRQCRFETDRQYQKPPMYGNTPVAALATFPVFTWTWRNGSAPALEAMGWRFESSRPDHCEVVELVPRLALNQEVRVRTVASQPHGDALSSCRAP